MQNSGNILSWERYALKPRPLESVLYSYTGDILSSCTINQQTVSFSHDALGRMTSDGLAGTTIAYNHFDKPRIISKNHVNSGNYSYLADGTLVDVEDGLGLGLVYRGSLIYKKLPSSLGALAFESAGFEGGRVTPGGVKYHLTDHLGSVVMVLDGISGTVDEANRYGEYGARTQLEGTSATAGRYHFSGKEDQDKTLGFPYTDFGARHLSTSLRRWLIPDPISEKYYGISPYAYCEGDPVNMVDPEGKFPDFIWDAVNVAIDVSSLVDNIKQGNWGAAAMDAGGMFLDIAAAAIPLVPGGAGTAIKAARLAKTGDKALDVAKAADKATDAIKAVDKASDTAAVVNGIDNTTGAAKAVHANSKTSTKAQHAYDIIDTDNEIIVKTGVSSGPVRKRDGKSCRAESQVRKWNNEPGYEKFKSIITHWEPEGVNAREKIYKYENDRADLLKQQGLLKDKRYHVRP